MAVVSTIDVCRKLLVAATVLAGAGAAVAQAQVPGQFPAPQARDFSALDAAAGEALFERVWVTAPSSTTSADGLGPYYNARSCAACHPAGGGGSRPEQLNFLTSDPVYGQLLQIRAIAGLAAEARISLTEQAVASITLPPDLKVSLRVPVLEVAGLQHGELTGGVSIRRAPSLRGLGLLAEISEERLEALADPDDLDGDGISGRIAVVSGADGTLRAGRFGWKAAVATLEEQTSRALSLDLGLGTRQFPAAGGDCTAHQTQCLLAAGPPAAEPEVSRQIEQLLLIYLEALPPPPAPTHHDEGERIFDELGCSKCHVPHLPGMQAGLRPWSDLLLHDMGQGLADPESAVATADAAEWRTAPLWGLGTLSHYLHDARAATLEEAILWHGGEAAVSVAAFRQLNGAQRERLLAWLRTL